LIITSTSEAGIIYNDNTTSSYIEAKLYITQLNNSLGPFECLEPKKKIKVYNSSLAIKNIKKPLIHRQIVFTRHK